SLEETLRTRFLPEFLNRIDETIIFHALERAQVTKIVDLQLQRLAGILRKRGLDLVVTDVARQRIAADGYDPVYGARPVKRVIQQSLQNPLATELLKGEYPEGTAVEIDFQDEAYTFRRSEQSEPPSAAWVGAASAS
ncbi:MAG: hypothetical protein MI725_18085, partial [Pirellulales bacterium]|nr:hypothetical protein [Pirellulales bacterium]